MQTLTSKIGTTNISAIGDGTVTGAISAISSNLTKIRYYMGSGDASIDISSWGFTNPKVVVSAEYSQYYKIVQATVSPTTLNVNTVYWAGPSYGWLPTTGIWTALVFE